MTPTRFAQLVRRCFSGLTPSQKAETVVCPADLSRRNFLKACGVTAVTLAVPKLILPEPKHFKFADPKFIGKSYLICDEDDDGEDVVLTPIKGVDHWEQVMAALKNGYPIRYEGTPLLRDGEIVRIAREIANDNPWSLKVYQNTLKEHPLLVNPRTLRGLRDKPYFWGNGDFAREHGVPFRRAENRT